MNPLIFSYRTSDDSVFEVRALSASIESIVSVTWRGVDVCADCWLHALEADERALLESILDIEAKHSGAGQKGGE